MPGSAVRYVSAQHDFVERLAWIVTVRDGRLVESQAFDDVGAARSDAAALAVA